MVTCSSYGGYPKNSMSWSIPGSQKVWKEVDSNVTEDPNTMMMNIISTAYFNCSKGELQHNRCSVGEVTSDMFRVCTPLRTTETIDYYAIPIATSALVVISIMALLLWKCKKRRTGAVAMDVRQEWGMDGQTDQVIILKPTIPWEDHMRGANEKNRDLHDRSVARASFCIGAMAKTPGDRCAASPPPVFSIHPSLAPRDRPAFHLLRPHLPLRREFRSGFNTFCMRRLTTLPSNHILLSGPRRQQQQVV
ncbi:hypothetical protein D9C73_015249 [Collichthys lucidus]|uniref:CD80-like immunoglobulin C2-set domain-containing protein n=1 Tax=Collichthys lucidus TaxID=240159 RepID=A0A4U5V468_COLLU|nr:hypothetical protein D9C73_015249 [Collichthys lucidus]